MAPSWLQSLTSNPEPSCPACVRNDRLYRLTPRLVHVRNLAITVIIGYIILCILLMTAVYVARKSRTVICSWFEPVS